MVKIGGGRGDFDGENSGGALKGCGFVA